MIARCLAFVLFVAAASAPALSQARPITISINGTAVSMNPPPRFANGVLLVPVRKTIEALGLTFERRGKNITTQAGSKTVLLTVGSRTAQIDGQNVPLGTPVVEIDNVLYAPLRFFTGVLGAQAQYDKKTNSVTISSQLVGKSAAGMVSSGGQIVRFGSVAAVDVLSDPPTLTLGYNATIKTIPISRNAIIEMQDVNANVATPGELGDVRPGDFARVEMKKNGSVERVVDAFGSRSGRIAAVAGNQFVLDDGHVIGAGRTTEIALNGKAASFSDLLPGDVVSIRYNVESNEVREILASRSVAAAPAACGSARHRERRYQRRPPVARRRRRRSNAARDARVVGELRHRLVRHEPDDERTFAGHLRREIRDSARCELRRGADHRPSDGRQCRRAGRASAAHDLRFEHAARYRRFRAGRKLDG